MQGLSDKSISIYPVLIEYCNFPSIIKDLKYAVLLKVMIMVLLN